MGVAQEVARKCGMAHAHGMAYTNREFGGKAVLRVFHLEVYVYILYCVQNVLAPAGTHYLWWDFRYHYVYEIKGSIGTSQNLYKVYTYKRCVHDVNNNSIHKLGLDVEYQ